MTRETVIQFQVRSYKRLNFPCLTLIIKRYGSKMKGSNATNSVAPWPTPRCSINEKRAFGSPSTTIANITF